MAASLYPIALLALSTLTACGGLSSEGPPPAPPQAAGAAPPAPVSKPAGLRASTAELALAASGGRPRHFVITNSGEQAAQRLSLNGAEALPHGTTARFDCDTLAPGASCTLTITPGDTVSSVPMDPEAQPVRLTVTSLNANPLLLSVRVLGFGSVYQGGYVFHLDDMTPDTGSVGGKVLGTTLHVNEPWAEYPGNGGPPRPDFWNVVEGARSMTDGEANTQAIVAHMGRQDPPLLEEAYQAGACSVSQEGGQTGWYLPAICELAYEEFPIHNICGTQAKPQVPDNVKSRLIDPGLLRGLLSFQSSTEDKDSIDWAVPGQNNFVWMFGQYTDVPGNDQGWIAHTTKDHPDHYRCVRRLTP